MTSTTLQKLLNSCKAGKRDSQKELYRHFYNYGMTICSRYARDREEAREILNDGFLKAFTHLEQYDASRSFKAWLNRILVNTCIDYFRKNRTNPQLVDLIHAQHVEVEPIVIQQLSAAEISNLVQKLSPGYRMVFNLHAVEGFKHTEIAEKLGITVGTSKSNLAKARVKLKAMIYSLDDKKSKYG